MAIGKYKITRFAKYLVFLLLSSFISVSCGGGGSRGGGSGNTPSMITATCTDLAWCAAMAPNTALDTGTISGSIPKMSSVYYKTLYPGALATQIQGAEGPSGVMDDWSGGALDTVRDRLYVFGGGHAAYYGDEVYSFDLHILQWSMLTFPNALLSDPSRSSYLRCPPWQVGPCSHHNYNGMDYLPPPVDKFIIMNRPNLNDIDGVAGSVDVDPTNLGWYTTYMLSNLGSSPTWELHTPLEYVAPPYGNEEAVGHIGSYDPVTGFYFTSGTGRAELRSYNPATDTFTEYGLPLAGGSYQHGNFLSYNCTGAIDPTRRLFVAIGKTCPYFSQGIVVWDISNLAAPYIQGTVKHTSGPNGVELAYSPGFAFDTAINKFVAWSGGSSLYVLDPDTWTWSLAQLTGDTVTAPNVNGTFGRFRYDPNLDVFVVVNKTTENVFILKLNNSQFTNASSCTLSSVTNTNLTLNVETYKEMSYQVTANNTPTMFWVNGLPGGYGVSIDPNSGLISGVPTKAGTYNVTIGAQNGCGTGPGTNLTINVVNGNHFHNGANSYETLQATVNAATAGDTITVDAGNYMDMYTDITKSVTIKGLGTAPSFASFGSDQFLPRTHGTFDANNGSIYNHGIFLTEDNTTVVLDNIEIYGAKNSFSDGLNAAAIWYQGGLFTIANSYIHNNQNGFLGGKWLNGTVTITNSVFDNNGRCDQGKACAHGAYIGEVSEATITNSTFTNTHIGHHIKSRAHITTISNTIEDDGSSNPGASLEIDFPDGGESTVTCNVAIKNKYAGNQYLIEYGEEAAVNGLNPVNSLSITESLFVNNFGPYINNRHINGIVNTRPDVNAYVGNNTFVRFETGYYATGAGTFTLSGNTYTDSDTDPLASCGPIGANLSIQGK